VLAVLVVVTLLFTAALLAMVREAAQLKKSVAMLERRVAALELENATTTVIEPEPTPPRPPNALLN
jgi:hypothetical protein